MKKAMRWLIWNHERERWWKPNRRGYTHVKVEAGRYTLEEAIAICQDANVGCSSKLGGVPEETICPDFMADQEGKA